MLKFEQLVPPDDYPILLTAFRAADEQVKQGNLSVFFEGYPTIICDEWIRLVHQILTELPIKETKRVYGVLYSRVDLDELSSLFFLNFELWRELIEVLILSGENYDQMTTEQALSYNVIWLVILNQLGLQVELNLPSSARAKNRQAKDTKEIKLNQRMRMFIFLCRKLFEGILTAENVQLVAFRKNLLFEMLIPIVRQLKPCAVTLFDLTGVLMESEQFDEIERCRLAYEITEALGAPLDS